MSTVAAQATLLEREAHLEPIPVASRKRLPQDNLVEWDLLDLPVAYYACHHFDT
jgi:hypothetical protein